MLPSALYAPNLLHIDLVPGIPRLDKSLSHRFYICFGSGQVWLQRVCITPGCLPGLAWQTSFSAASYKRKIIKQYFLAGFQAAKIYVTTHRSVDISKKRRSQAF